MATKELSKMIVPNFAVQVDHPRNSDQIIQSIPGCRLRSAISGVKGFKDKNGEIQIPLDQQRDLGQYPNTPGMILKVNPAKCSYCIEDPMFEDVVLCERLQKRMEAKSEVSIAGKLQGVPPQEGTLDVHRMKTLCREIITLLKLKNVKVVKGPTPDLDDVDDLPGHYLLNPGSRVPNGQPQFEKDYDKWVEQLGRSGG